VIGSEAVDTLEVTQGIRSEKATLLRLTTNIQKSSIYGTDFCCKHNVKTVESIGKHPAIADDGTTN
jgi:hypothetical protein